MDQATLASWHDFYVTMGTSAASLIGLLFVALSINLDAITGGSRDDLRAFAEQAFNSFSVVLLIAVGFLIPSNDPSSLGVAYLLLATIAGVRMLRRTPAIWRGRQRGQLDSALFWRFILPLGRRPRPRGRRDRLPRQPAVGPVLARLCDHRPPDVGRPQLMGSPRQGGRGPTGCHWHRLTRWR